ncbi:TonB-dependent receptor domain-containing protein [Permianibacter aggregans]|uniref:Iron complex outermembrane receptor protein n=1 Tax=Permianibacter aggregans TaxID=1510150 RepID=A0A4R6UGM4_9GAMM|nr:TonB-dependent receptor [Permianibacter aggregans]QGX39633.1 TonB-dependent receptor [Permianibacter aggregans]TDQ45462.1 iron complex outermembrane receptor protein [Permianibacter aggregans]
MLKKTPLFEYAKSPLAHAITGIMAMTSLNVVAQEAAESESKAEEERVIVVGSRIRRDSFNSEQPVDIIMAEDAIKSGVSNVAELLQRLTVASGSPQVTSATSSEFVQEGGIGVETFSLRGLGPNRTLVLLNGRRAGPAGTRGETSAFDFNTLPISMVERIEILKDGASSLYGSDAVAGVVNIITKTGDESAIDAFISQPEESGGERSRLSLTFGRSFDGGSFRVTADYDKQQELARGDRDYFACGQRYIFDAVTGERADPIDPRTGTYHCRDLLWGHVWIYDYQDAGGNVLPGMLAQYDYDGDLGNYLTPFPNMVDPNNPDFMVTPPGWFPVNYDRTSDGLANADHPFQDRQSLVPESERATIYGQAEFDVSDNVNLYTEVLLNRRKTDVNGYRQFWGYVYNENFFAGNPLSAGWQGAQWLSPTPITDHSFNKITVDYQRYVVGATGDIGDWYWDASYQFSRSEGEYTNAVIFDDSITDQNFLDGSCVGMTTSVRGVPCIDIPWLDPQFLAGNISPEMRAFLFGTDTGETVYDQSSFDVVFSNGNLLELPAGDLGIAVGAHYRTDEITDTPGATTLASNAWGASSAGITAGDDTTTAFFGEARIPLLRDLPGAYNVELTLSARYTDVDTSGSDTTYKAGLSWAVDETFRIRASHGTSFRAPALFELYLADQTSFISQRAVDPCIRWAQNLTDGNITQRMADNCAAEGIAPDYAGGAITATVVTGGGLGILESETSEATTYGFVWKPTFADLSVSVDYFDFLIEGEITQLGAGNIVFQCYDSTFFPTDPLCSQFERSALDNRIETVRDQFINIAEQTNRGYDVKIEYRTDVGPGNLVLSTEHTFQKEQSRGLFADTVEDRNGQFGDPKHVANFTAGYDIDNWSFDWIVNYIGPVSDVEDNEGDTSTYRGQDVRIVIDSDAVYYHAFSVGYEFDDSGLSARVGVANVFDEEPPKISDYANNLSNVGQSAFYTQYDWLGRRVFMNLSYKF